MNKFAGEFSIETVYIHDIVRRNGYEGVADRLNGMVRQQDIWLMFLDVEFYFAFGIDLIQTIPRHVRLVLTAFDDIVLHHVNYVNALACDLVLCADPIAVMKYRETGVAAEVCFLENSRLPFEPHAGAIKDIDVLFFGDLTKGGRKEFLSKIAAQGIAITIHAPELQGVLAYTDLARLMARAKIVLNFSQTHDCTDRPETFLPIERAFQLKGRVLEAGLAKAACVSEYAPSIEYLFGTEAVPMFRTAEECGQMLVSLLTDEDRRIELAERLHAETIRRFEEAVQVPFLIKTIQGLPIRNCRRPKRVPYYYVSLVAKTRFLQGRRPLRAWIKDLLAFLFRANVYAWGQRWLAILQACVSALARASRLTARGN
ncbi:MAG: glycosyltransferase [Nitrospira sp.]|nr:glycosyltransferase [Nitrospira sp.]